MKNHFTFDVLQFDDYNVVLKEKKTIYNTDSSRSLSEWIKMKHTTPKISYPHLTSPLKIAQVETCGFFEDSLGYVQNKSNNVYENLTGVSFFSAPYSNAHGFVVSKNNFFKSCVVFTVRKLVTKNWTNEKDEYLAPLEEKMLGTNFYNDTVIYSLFQNGSNQSSLRQVEYKGQMWDIKNEFFWMSRDRMKELADNMGYDELYNDARTASDRHVYKLLFGEECIYDKLSPDAKAVLDKATELVELSMEMRQVMANDENHLNSWDAGYAQLKLVWKEYFPEQFKEFRQLYKNMEDRMRPLVYELGFLMK